jgi:predicted hydrocarbon binding protein
MSSDDILKSLNLDSLIADQSFARDATGLLVDSAGTRVVLVSAGTTRGFRHVLEAEKPGAWSAALKAGGVSSGVQIATGLDTTLTARGKPALAALPLEACLALLEHHFAACGWGRLKVDLNDAAAYGFVVARLEHAFHVEALTDVDGFVDPMLAGVLQGFFCRISGQELGCEEIGCSRGGYTHCTFVITDPERLASLRPMIGSETVEAVLAHLRQ